MRFSGKLSLAATRLIAISAVVAILPGASAAFGQQSPQSNQQTPPPINDGKTRIFVTDNPIETYSYLAHGNAAFAAAERGDNPRTVEIQADMLQGCPANVIVTSDPYQATYILVFRRQNGKRSAMFVFGGLSGLALSAAMKVDGASLFKTNGDMVYSTKQRTVEKTVRDVCNNLPSEVTLSADKARLGADAVSNSVVPAVSASAIMVRSEKPQAQAQVNVPLVDVAQVPQTNASSIVTISSSPIGAEISVGTDFVGNTPSSINVSPGRHLITITKSGYKDWQRAITLSGGTVNLNADLVPGATAAAPVPAASTDAATIQKIKASEPQIQPAVQPRVEDQTATGWIGITTRDQPNGGVVITRVLDNSGAATAGLRVGDVITQLNGSAVKNGMDFDVAVAHSKIGSQIRLSYMRGAWVSDVTVIVGKII